MKRALLITHANDMPSDALAEIDGLLGDDGFLDRYEIDNSWTFPSLAEYSAVILFVRFTELIERSSIPWGEFSGLRVLLDQDSFQDFTTWYGPNPLNGKWSWALRHYGFDLLICSGARSAEYFNERGIRAAVLHKAYNASLFSPLRQPRAGLCHYGSPYLARRRMIRRLSTAKIQVDRVSAPYELLNETLNAYAGVVICNMTGSLRLGRVGAHIEHRFPGTLIRTGSAPEPMIKNFEAMAAGCCVFMDRTPDDHALGFRDGENCVIYEDLDALVASLDAYANDQQRLESIGERGALLVRERHTWQHRGQELRAILKGLM